MSKVQGWLLAAALLLSGAVVGALGMEAWRVWSGGPFGRMERLGPAAFVVDRMTKDLGLTKDQQDKITPLAEEMFAKTAEARKPFLEIEEAIFEEYQAKIRQLLTPEQAVKHEEVLSRIREHRKRMLAGPPPGPPPGGPHGPPPGGPMPWLPKDGPPPPPPRQ